MSADEPTAGPGEPRSGETPSGGAPSDATSSDGSALPPPAQASPRVPPPAQASPRVPPPGPWPPRFTPEADGAPPPTSDERTWATLAHVLVLVGGVVAPLVVWLVKKDESSYVEHHAREALNFQITVLLCCAAAGVAMCVPLAGLAAVPLVFALGLLNLVLTILAAMDANAGRRYRYPFAIRLVSTPAPR